MQSVLTCLRDAHDARLIVLSAVVCTIGVYASFAIGRHSIRQEGRARTAWATVSVGAAGCTAWATHMILMLAFLPGMQSGFDPFLTVLSLLLGIAGIGLGIVMTVGRVGRERRFSAGIVLGLGVTLLHYVGQAGYVVTGTQAWDFPLVFGSIAPSLAIFGGGMVLSGERNRLLRQTAAPLFLLAIGVMHLCGMAALTLIYDPRVRLPAYAVSPDVAAPVVAAISLGLLLLAILGLRFTLAARAQLRRDQARLAELADLAIEGLAVFGARGVTIVNKSLERLSGISRQELAGASLDAILPGFDLADLPEGEERDAELASADGQPVPVRVLRRDVQLGSERQTVIAIRDQRERLRTEATMRRLAFSDALTQMPNRARFNDLLALQSQASRESKRPFAVLLIDLDRFKSVNDTFGHAIGDQLLRRVAGRLKSVMREGDVIARLGGDEFAAFVSANDSFGQAGTVADEIVDLLGRPFLIDGQVLDIGGSVGIALFLADGVEPEELLQHADLALYRAKAEGGSTFRFFEAEMNATAQARRTLERDLRRAVSREEFEVYYQPQVEPQTAAYQGAEALVRWRHPERGMASPAEFIPLAEQIGLIATIGEWVLRAACAEACRWPGELSIAVNLSPVQLRDKNFPHTVATILAETGLPHHRLELEITESALLQDDGVTSANIHALHAMDIRISMDDFGTGYSSLSYLHRFPFNKIKIDQSFIRQVPADQHQAQGLRRTV